MPLLMLLLGGLIGTAIGLALGSGMAAIAGLPVYGPITNVLLALVSLGPAGLASQVLSPITALFGAGLGLLVATIFMYVSAAIGVISGAALLEFFSRGLLIGASAAANFTIMVAIPWMPPGAAPTVFVILILALIPPVAGNRFYERVLGFLGWVLPLNYLMLPLGLALFLVLAPAALFTGGGLRFDFLTWTIETAGGTFLPLFTAAAFNVGNFTFLPVASTGPTTGVSAHETGHTLNGSAFGGFFYWIGAVDENVPPLRRMGAAYSEMLAESHFAGPTGGPFIPMW